MLLLLRASPTTCGTLPRRASLCETDQSISLAIEQILFLYTIYNNTAAARRRFNLRARAFPLLRWLHLIKYNNRGCNTRVEIYGIYFAT